MPFDTGYVRVGIGIPYWVDKPSTYCQNNTAASDYGKCYNVSFNKAVFVQTDTTTYPTLQCEADNTCIRYTTTTYNRILNTLFDYTNKQAIVQYINTRSHSVLSVSGNVGYIWGHPFPLPSTFSDATYAFLFPSFNYELSSWPVYDPLDNWKAYLNPYSITLGRVFVLKWQGSLFTSKLLLICAEAGVNNIWYAGNVIVRYAYESSPLAVVPLDYDRDYVQYQELRSAFGFSINGVDQPGWNADDMVRILKELFPNRAWAVFDDRQYVLYLYNLTPDYVPDWLIEKLSPTAMKVLQPPADAAVAKAWLDLLNERNAQIPAPAVGI